MAPAIKNLVRLSAAGYSKNVLGRWELYQLMVSKEKGAHEHLKRLQPAENKLFGGKVPGLTKVKGWRSGDYLSPIFAKLLNKLSPLSWEPLG